MGGGLFSSLFNFFEDVLFEKWAMLAGISFQEAGGKNRD